MACVKVGWLPPVPQTRRLRQQGLPRWRQRGQYLAADSPFRNRCFLQTGNSGRTTGDHRYGLAKVASFTTTAPPWRISQVERRRTDCRVIARTVPEGVIHSKRQTYKYAAWQKHVTWGKRAWLLIALPGELKWWFCFSSRAGHVKMWPMMVVPMTKI